MAATREKLFTTSVKIIRNFSTLFMRKVPNSSVTKVKQCPEFIVECRHVNTFTSLHILKAKRHLWALGLTTISIFSGIILYANRKSRYINESMTLKLPVTTVYAAKPIYTDINNNDINTTTTKSKSQFNFIADVVEETAPAVVYIEIQGSHPFSGASMTVSNGSGFIVQPDGLILTNAHVVANRTNVIVKLHDGRDFVGRVECVDLVTDLATIRINQNNLPTLKLGCSATLRPGEWVVAMGSPLSLSNTITAGVISSVHRGSRELGLHNKNMEYIQTDASITDGEVIGINTMKVTAGISFAIPSDKVKEFLKQSEDFVKRNKGVSKGVPKRRYIGITMLSLTPSIIMELQQRQADFPSDVENGVLVWRVVVGSPAYNGGLQPGDVITKINNSPVKSSEDVYKYLESTDQLKFVVLRKQQKIVLTIISQPSD